ncbi:MAG: polyphosphate polymerase domain-containing protein [bacterium]|nr:polyphosphate polymerase domain-containing protein [bacterium]
MAQEIFKRYEKKYLLTAEQYEWIRLELTGHMTMDDYGRHTISNIYFDTEQFELIQHSIKKPVYKEKLRLRAYGKVSEGSLVFVELKKKYDGIVYKRRVQLSLEEANAYLYEGKYPQKDSQILREIDYAYSFYRLLPKMFIAYDRIALFGNEDEQLRVTFDENIRYRKEDLELLKGSHGSTLLPVGVVLMEVKIPGAMPVWMSHLFSELGIYPTSYSKYGACYKRELVEQMAQVRAVERIKEEQKIRRVHGIGGQIYAS